MCNLLDLNYDCLLEIVKRLPRNKDRLSLFVVSDRFRYLLENVLKEMDSDYLYSFVRALDSNKDRDVIELICSFIKRVKLGKVDSDTVDFFAIYEKKFTNLESLLLTEYIPLESEKNSKLEQVLKPMFERIKDLFLYKGRSNLILHSKNLERARFIGEQMLDDETFTTFLRNNKETLKVLDYREERDIPIVEATKILSEMKCLEEVYIRLYRRNDYVDFMNAIARGNTVKNLELCLRWWSESYKHTPMIFNPVTSVENLTLTCVFFTYRMDNFSFDRFPNLKRLSLDIETAMARKQILKWIKNLPHLELISATEQDVRVRGCDVMEIERYLAEHNRKFTIDRYSMMAGRELRFLTIR